jgi:hypothetical protein
MTAADKAAFGGLMAMLGAAFRESLDAALIRSYWDALQDLDLDAVDTAVRTAVRDSEFFPRVAQLRKLAGAGAPSAGLINAMISRHIGTRGGDRLAPADPFLRLVLERLGGIRAASDMAMADRLKLLTGVLPGCIQAATARGIPMPTEALPALPPAAVPELPEPGSALMEGRMR